MNYIIFGAGQIGCEALELVGEENIVYFIDNDVSKQGSYIASKKIYSFIDGIEKRNDEQIIIAVSKVYENQIVIQLRDYGVEDYCLFTEIKRQITKNKILNRKDNLKIYSKAIQWIVSNSITGEGIINNSKLLRSYPEVTGYFIPSLIRWGYKELAVTYSRWLCSIQKEDGSWYDTLDMDPYIFDSAQILKGLLAVRPLYKDVNHLDEAIRRGCDWILTNMTEDGQLITPSKVAWGNIANELIHTYCLSPLMEAGKLYNDKKYSEAATRSLTYYKEHYYNEIVNFSMLSHFYAYVVEAMLDMGEVGLAREAMKNMESFQKESGAIPAHKDADWVCSTGLFQMSLIWFRLGDVERGDKAFEYACALQNDSGGWYGSYVSEENADEVNTYFPDAEISWANKYFLDALFYKNKAEFNKISDVFEESISKTDERYDCILGAVEKSKPNTAILDVGCGKGRYLKNLLQDIPDRVYYGVDISKNVMAGLEEIGIECQEGTLTDIPYDNDTFSVTYSCEALEHAIDIENSIKEMARVTNRDGLIIVIDKNKESYGTLEIGNWEQWFDEEGLGSIIRKYCKDVTVKHGLKYEKMGDSDLFTAWIGVVG